MHCWSTRPTTVPARITIFTQSVRPYVSPSQNFKIKGQSLPTGTVGWPSGSLMTPVSLLLHCLAKFGRKKIAVSKLCLNNNSIRPSFLSNRRLYYYYQENRNEAVRNIHNLTDPKCDYITFASLLKERKGHSYSL